MNIAITGSSGFVAKQLIPLLKEKGLQPILLARSREIAKIPPKSQKIADYNDLDATLERSGAVLHLAAMNNNQQASLEEFKSINVDFLKTIVEASLKASVRTFIFMSSTHVQTQKGFYAQTKREAEEFLLGVEGMDIKIIRSPAIYGKAAFNGKLKPISQLPLCLQAAAISLATSFRSTLDAEGLSEIVVRLCKSSGSEIIEVSNMQFNNPVYLWTKRAVDVGFALTIVLLFSWLFLFIWLVVKLSSPGPGFFRQTRVGRHGIPFTCFKFRTMFSETEQVPTHEVNRSSITRFGSLLRKTKLDELPQVWNILRNEMSFVGPRPCLPSQTELVEVRQKLRVFDVKPGITGWAQIKGIDMSDPSCLAKFDKEYIVRRTIPFDTMILVRTLFGYGFGDKIKSV